MKIEKSRIEDIELFRLEYLESLPKFQDVFLELMVNKSNCYKLYFDNSPIGYFIVSVDNVLLELFLQNRFASQSAASFDFVVNELNISSVYCKSFDYQLLDCCLANALPYKIIGCLYRDFREKGLQIEPGLSFRYAEISDLPFLLQQDDDVFEPKQLLETFIKNKGIIFLENADSIQGCGFLTKVHPKYNYYDIGVWVSPHHRGKGNATQIMLYMIDLCLRKQQFPICGCDVNNLASQKMLEKLGFISEYKLIEFEINTEITNEIKQ